MILLLDNYDSFTWNVEQALAVAGAQVRVLRNDACSVAELLALAPQALVLSPGPGLPAQAGIQAELIAKAPAHLPIWGICLGHQALVEHYGGRLLCDPEPVHGRASQIVHDGSGLFAGAPCPLQMGRYHSWHADRASLPPELVVNAWTQEGLVMGIRHATRPQMGVQFHPESILSPEGAILFDNFLRMVKAQAQS